MVSIVSLWLPILLSAVAVFVISSLLHMLFTYHNSDFKKLPSEDEIMNDLRKYNIPTGDYMLPFCDDPKERKSEQFQEKMNKGPVLITTVFPSGEMKMGKSLVLWFIYCLIIGIFSAYITGHAVQAGSDYLSVFRFVGAVSFAGYSLALMQDSIWYMKSWGATFKSMFDGLIYALFTAGIFGWLWPVM